MGTSTREVTQSSTARVIRLSSIVDEAIMMAATAMMCGGYINGISVKKESLTIHLQQYEVTIKMAYGAHYHAACNRNVSSNFRHLTKLQCIENGMLNQQVSTRTAEEVDRDERQSFETQVFPVNKIPYQPVVDVYTGIQDELYRM